MQKGYAICLNEWIEDERITNELALLLKISSLTAKDGHCFASNSYFSNLFKKTEVSISRKIKKLESLRYIEIDYEKRGCEIVKRKIRLSKMLIDDYQKRQSTIIKNVKDNNTSINNTSINNNPLTPFQGETCESFNSFWAEYPKKVAKPSAVKAFQKAIKKTDLPTILSAIRRHKKTDQWKRDKGQFIPHPTTWLNQERWEDEIKSTSSGSIRDFF